MKSFFSILLALTLCLGMASITVFADDYDQELPEIGDANGDGYVDNTDASLILKYDAGLMDLSEDRLSTADVNYDETVDNTDASLVLKYDAGLIYDFCVEHEWDEGNCTTPKTCYWCGLTVGTAEGHKFENGACVNCDLTETEKSVFTTVSNYIVENGMEEEGVYAFVKMLSDTSLVMFEYDPDLPDTLTFALVTATDKEMGLVALHWDPQVAEGDEIAYMSMTETTMDMASGYVDSASFTATNPKIEDFYYDGDGDSETAKQTVAQGIVVVLTQLEAFLEEADLGYTLADFGYKAF